jgi:hypothetical protein
MHLCDPEFRYLLQLCDRNALARAEITVARKYTSEFACSGVMLMANLLNDFLNRPTCYHCHCNLAR